MKNKDLTIKTIRWAVSLGLAEFITDKSFQKIHDFYSASPSRALELLGLMATTGAMMASITYGTNFLLVNAEEVIRNMFEESKEDFEDKPKTLKRK